MTAKQYIDEKYGETHLGTIIDLCDIVSVILLMQEYADYNARLQIEKDRERIINEVVKYREHDCDTCACSCRGDLVINSNNDIRNLPITLD